MASRTLVWTGAHNNDFTNALNWDDITNNLNPAASPPASTDFVSFGLSSGGTVDFGGGSAEFLNVYGTPGPWTFSGTLTISGQPQSNSIPNAFSLSATITFSAVTLTAQGYGGVDGAVTVQGGSTVTTVGDSIGQNSGETGSLTLTGTGTSWHVESNTADNVDGFVTGYLSIGYGPETGIKAGGSGTLTVTAGAALLVDIGASLAGSIGSTGTATVSDGGTWTISGADGLAVGQAGMGSLMVNGGTVTADGGLTVGANDGGVGTLDIAAGGTVTNDGTYTFAGASAGSVGTIQVSGTGAVLNGTAALIIGNFGSGYMDVASDGVVNAGSLAVGQLTGSSGTLVAESGGAVTITGNAIIGNQASTTGTVTVAAGSTLTLDSGLTVGGSGAGTLTVGTGAGTSTVAVDGQIDVGQNAGSVGTLTIDAGGTVKDTEAPQSAANLVQIGYQGIGSVTATGTGALLDTNDNPLTIGYGVGGYGSLTVSNGGTVDVGSANSNTGNNALYIARNGIGLLTVDGAGSTFNSDGYAVVGRAGTGTILVENNGTLTISLDSSGTGGLSLGFGNSSNLYGIGGYGSATVTGGGLLSVAQNLLVGGDGVDGALNVNDGGIVDIGTELVVGYAALISGVTYSGNGNVAIGAGGTVQITGAAQDSFDAVNIGSQSSTASPLSSTGAITVSGKGALLNTNGSEIAVGSSGTGSLTISQGGSVVTGTSNSSVSSGLGVGSLGVGSVTVTGSGSSLTSDGFVFFGRAGTGNLRVENGATMTVYLSELSIGGANLGSSAQTSLSVGGTGTALVTAGGYVDTQVSLYVGSSGATGTVTVNNSGTVEAADRITIGNTATLVSGGTVTTATGTTTVTSATVYAAAGTINVGAGGTLETDGKEANGSSSIIVGNGIGSSGALNVSGAGAFVNAGGQRINIGNNGDGTVLVSQGGAVDAGAANYTDTEAAAYLGYAAGASGALTVTDAGSTFTAAGAMEVGVSGTGSLLVENGAAVRAASLDSAVDAGSTGIITVTGVGIAGGSGSGPSSDLTVTNQFTIGDTGSAELSILNGATATVGDMDIGLSAGSTGNVDLEGVDTLLHVTGDLHVGDAGAAVLTLGASTELTVDGDLFTGTKGRVVGLGGTIDPKHYYNTTTTTGPLTIVASVAIVNTGTFIAENGLLELNGPVTDTGVMQIQDGGVLQLDQSVAATQTVQFTTTGGTLDIKDPTDFAAVISGYATGDTVQVDGIAGQPAPIYSHAGGNTVLTYGKGVTLTFAGTFNAGDITADADPTPPPCFLVGTRIATVRGEVAVEDLRIGDMMLTASGATRPVRWIGTRSVNPARHPKPASVLPVRVRRDAFGYASPSRDLYLSPDHAVFVQDVLIPVKYLIDGKTIRQTPAAGPIIYFHIELDCHDVLLAEGLPAESYLETGYRATFANGGVPMVLHPDFGERVWEAEGCAPLVVTGPKLEAARRLLVAEAAITAWRANGAGATYRISAMAA